MSASRPRHPVARETLERLGTPAKVQGGYSYEVCSEAAFTVCWCSPYWSQPYTVCVCE